jgi:hypothetical protein
VFPSLLNGIEKLEFVKLRQRLFETSWASTEQKIEVIENTTQLGFLTNYIMKAIRGEANATTLAEVTSFVDRTLSPE